MNRKKKIICIVLCIAMVVTVSGGFNKKISPKHIFAYSENMVNTAQFVVIRGRYTPKL